MILDSYNFEQAQVDYRERKLELYRTEEGEKELFNLLSDLGLFKAITPEAVNLRNYAIGRLEVLGLLDESKLRKGLNYMLNLPSVMDESKIIKGE